MIRKRLNWSVLIVALFVLMGSGKQYAADYPTSFEETLALGLPVVVIETVDGEMPTVESVSPPEGSMGNGAINATKVPGSVTVYGSDGSIMYESGEYEKKKSGMTVKIRGNSSAHGVKKPYKIKLQKKGDMLGRGDKKYNDKNWVLIRSYNMKTHMGHLVAGTMENPWVPQFINVNLFFNGEYHGLYLLGEAVEANEDCRIDVAEDGFVMEHDPYWWTEDGAYLLSKDNPRYNYTFKYPDYEDADEEMLGRIQNVLDNYEEAVRDGSFANFIDIDSSANFVLGHDVLGTSDGGGVNWYLTKYSLSDDSPIRCGPLWDFYSSEENKDKFSQLHLGRFSGFFHNVEFQKRYISRWYEVRDALKDGVLGWIENLKTSTWDAYNISVNMDRRRWNSTEAYTDAVYDRLSEWYGSRFDWLDAAVDEMADAIFKNESVKLGFPVLRLATENQSLPTASIIQALQDCIGTFVYENDAVKASLKMYDKDGNITISAEMGDVSFIIGRDAREECNGMSYEIVAENAVTSLEGEQSSFAWKLLPDYELRTPIAAKISELLQPHSAGGEFVNLFVNDSYIGLYWLCEDRMKFSTKEYSPLFVAIENHRWWGYDGNYFPGNISGNHSFTFIYPELHTLSSKDIYDMTRRINSYESAMMDGENVAMLDPTTIVSSLLMHDFMGTGDEVDRVFWQDSEDDIYNAILIGGVHSSESTVGEWSGAHLAFYSKIMDGKKSPLVSEYISMWRNRGEEVFNALQTYLTEELPMIEEAYNLSIASTPNIGKDTTQPMNDAISRATKWYADRKIWLDGEIEKMMQFVSTDMVAEEESSLSVISAGIQANSDMENVEIFSIDGGLIFNGKIKAGEVIGISSRGIYMIKAGEKTLKVSF